MTAPAKELDWFSDLKQLSGDYPHYAFRCLKILSKDGGMVPFKFNRAQAYLHERLEEQYFEHNHIRALVLKGRQQGISTYTEGRYYWKVQFRFAVQAYILTHMADATDNLFRMVDRFHRNMPDALRPETGLDSRKQLHFTKLDSGYKVGTAGSKGAGRSGTYHYFHGSEVAFWPNAETHAAGALQTVGANNGSEVILESTANGPGGYFYNLWQQAIKGFGDFIAVFIPWYWQPEYRREAPPDWRPEGEELERVELYGLDREQAHWMHVKNIELGGSPGVLCPLFKQEYPCTATEAFQTSGLESLCDPELVARARKMRILDPIGPRVMGVDPARMGSDATAMIDRKGRRAWNLARYHKKKNTEVAAIVANRIEAAKREGDEYRAVFIDVNGVGAGVVDVLHEMGFESLVVPVNFGGRALDEELYVNKRVEMWCLMADWLNQEGGVEIPDSDSLHSDLVTPTYTHNVVRNQKVLESKEQMKKRGIPSPDDGDALALTFAFPVAQRAQATPVRRRFSDWRVA